MLDNLLILMLVIMAFTPFLLIAAVIEQYSKYIKSVKADELARKHRAYVEQHCKR